MNKIIEWLKKRYLLVVIESHYFGGSTKIINYFFFKRQLKENYVYFSKQENTLQIGAYKRTLKRWKKIRL